MKNKCTECGATAIKEEDFALFEYQNLAEVKFVGFIKTVLCENCIKKIFNKHIYTGDSWGKIAIKILLIILGLFGLAYLFFALANFEFRNMMPVVGLISLGLIIYELRDKMNAMQSAKNERIKFEKEIENGFKCSLTNFIRSNFEIKNDITLVNVLDVSPTINESDTIDDILQKKELTMPIPAKQKENSRERVQICNYVEFYTTYVANPMPEWINAAYKKRCADYN